MSDWQLETQRLIIRNFSDSDTDFLEDIFGDPIVMKYSLSGPKPRAEIHTFIQRFRQLHQEQGFSHWAVTHKEHPGLLGVCGLLTQQVDGMREIEIGYRFATAHWGQGYATEAALRVRDYAFNEVQVERLIAIIDADNEASWKLAGRLGMHMEKETLVWNIPVRIYVISRDDFLEITAKQCRQKPSS